MSPLTIALAGLGSRGKDAYAQALAGDAEWPGLWPSPIRTGQGPGGGPAIRGSGGALLLQRRGHAGPAEAGRRADPVHPGPQHVPRPFPALYRGYDISWRSPFPRSGPVQGDFVRGPSNGAEGGRLPCAALRALYRKIKEVLDSGVLGRLMSIQAIENVGYWHQAHSFVRGNWRRSDETPPCSCRNAAMTWT